MSVEKRVFGGSVQTNTEKERKRTHGINKPFCLLTFRYNEPRDSMEGI